ncbi:MAG: hypothetical protein JNM67_05845 [Bacteroidetes bacterium]|nr:hypothetical protein [Bacteroidota bacterium]
MKIFDDIETIFFCDESKFYTNAGDYDDAIYYFSIAVDKSLKNKLENELKNILAKRKVQAPVYHSTSIFSERGPRKYLMDDLCNLIVENKLQCFCFKYSKPLLFKATRQLSYLNNGILNFEKDEFQALFYFIILFNTHLRDEKPNMLKQKFAMFFDKNVYGVEGTEQFSFPDSAYVIKFMTFVEKSQIRLLALPDFLGYIFRKAKLSNNRFEAGDNSLETSRLVINSYNSLLRITESNLFNFLDMDEKLDALALILASYVVE